MTRALIKLTRWREFVPWAVPLTLLGGLVAHHTARRALDARLAVVLAANLCLMAFAFMVNDLEDAEDDRFSPERAARNPVTMGEVSRRAGWRAAGAAGAAGMGLFLAVGRATFAAGLVMAALAYLYSWQPVRLKAIPLFDVVSHVLMLSTLLFVTAYAAYDRAPSAAVWLVIAALTLFSAYGQFYNQVRDFEADRAAGLHNTAHLVGKRAVQRLGYASLAVAGGCMILAAALGAFPPGVIVISPVVILPGAALPADRDLRGAAAHDLSGRLQRGLLVGVNLLLAGWLGYVVAAGR